MGSSRFVCLCVFAGMISYCDWVLACERHILEEVSQRVYTVWAQLASVFKHAHFFCAACAQCHLLEIASMAAGLGL